MRIFHLLTAAALLAFVSTAAAAEKEGSVLDHTVKDIKGQDVDLADYKGKVLLIVNTASKCGYTPQYKGLAALHEKYADRGLVVLGFPSNDFGKQEPGTEEEIAEFCSTNYNVQFPMFSKVVVKGPEQCELYEELTSANPEFAGPVKWNFEKFLISRDGKVVGRFASAIGPDAPKLTEQLEAELAK